MQKFLCCDAANHRTHGYGKIRLTFAHGYRIGRIPCSIACPVRASNAVNLRVSCNRQLTLAVRPFGNRESRTQTHHRARRIKCSKKLGFLELSYARIACDLLNRYEYIFIITRNETARVGAAAGTRRPTCVTGHCLNQSARGSCTRVSWRSICQARPRGRPGSIACPVAVCVERKCA